MPNRKCNEFIVALQQAVEDYRAMTIIPLQVAGYLGYRSAETRELMNALSSLNAYDPHESLLSAIKAIIKYIDTVGTSGNPVRGFWVKSLQPCLQIYAADPLTDVPEKKKEEYLELELTLFPCSPQIIKQRGMLFSAFGIKNLANQLHLNTESGITNESNNLNSALMSYESNKQHASTPGAARILQTAFACTKKIEGKIAAFRNDSEMQASSTHRYQGHRLLQLLDKIDHEELLIFLRRLNKSHASINDVMPSLLYKIADRKQAQDALAPPALPYIETPFASYPREAKLNKLTLDSINCLKEIKRLNPLFDFAKANNKLYAIITGDAEHTFATSEKTNIEIADAIALRPLWKEELMNAKSTIHLDNIIPYVDAKTILGILTPTNKTARKI